MGDTFPKWSFKETNEPHIGGPFQQNGRNMNKSHDLIIKDHCILVKMIAEILQISCKRVSSIICDNRDMQKLSARQIPKLFNADQKWNYMIASKAILTQFYTSAEDFVAKFVTTDEMWFHHNDGEMKEQ
ncbi:uncharacterized protein LOC111639353 [Centruroides sculpturatus]|uniref:uncharacterized protein LOC111639353 n=1 Tax=Centruroides sculpturatus TaxID=218467 RepID=UPI000C6DDA4A|nr:uncharacterized protein LOC111639353 [Centruroides sculpturatus]